MPWRSKQCFTKLNLFRYTFVFRTSINLRIKKNVVYFKVCSRAESSRTGQTAFNGSTNNCGSVFMSVHLSALAPCIMAFRNLKKVSVNIVYGPKVNDGHHF